MSQSLSQDIESREVGCAKCGRRLVIPTFNRQATISILCEGCFQDKQSLGIDWKRLKPKPIKEKKVRKGKRR